MINSGFIYNSELNKIAKAIQSVSTIPNGEDMIKSLLLNAIEKYSGTENTVNNSPKKTILKFAKEEIEKMPKTFKKEFKTHGCTARIYKRVSQNRSVLYMIKYRRNGYNIEISSKNLDEVKKKFINQLQVAEKKPTSNYKNLNTLNSFTEYYFNKFRIKKVSEATFRSDLNRYKNHIKPAFGDKQISKITPSDCQDIIDSLIIKNKGKTADEVYSLLSIIFKGAIDHEIIAKNPLKTVVITKHDRVHGTAFTKNEEQEILSYFNGTKYSQSIALLLYCGLRPNELSSVSIDNQFVIAKNSKRKNGKIELKKIPISPMLLPYIKNGIEKSVPYESLRKEFKEKFPNHILYDFRTTFYTRLKECNVADNAIKEFAGHSFGTLGNAYTDLSDEYLLKEGKKYIY